MLGLLMKTIVCCTMAAILLSGHAAAQLSNPVLEREWWQRLDLSEHIGQTYLQTYLADVIGIHAEIVEDFSRTVTVADPNAVLAVVDIADPRVRERDFAPFTDGQAGFVRMLEPIAGQSVAIADLRTMLEPVVDAEAKSGEEGLALSISENLVLLASGAGTLVRLDDNNYFYNVGYQDPDRFSGRSYGVSNQRRLLDPSDPDYLNGLDAYLGVDNSETSVFYSVLFDLLTNSDPRGIRGLSADGQAVVTNFMTIYTAELDRNHMADLSPTQWAWQIDLAQVTLLTAYGGASGMAVKDGELVQCSALAYDWRHGIGPRASFVQLSRLIGDYMVANHPNLVFDVIALTPLTDVEVVSVVEGDVLRRALTFLNRPESLAAATANAELLSEAMVALLQQVRSDSDDITAFLETRLPVATEPCDEAG